MLKPTHMKKTTLYLFLLFLATACGVQKTQNLISEGAYDTAIEKATQKLRKNKTNKKSNEYVAFLEEAFIKAKERDNRDISFLVKDANIEKEDVPKIPPKTPCTAIRLPAQHSRFTGA